eukprot:CFRG3799T1
MDKLTIGFLEDFYVLGHLLGKGGFGKVVLGLDLENEEEVAVKLLPVNNCGEAVVNECKLLRRMGRHENITKYHGVYITRDRTQYAIVMELLPCGELLDVLGLAMESNYGEPEVAVIFRQVASAIDHCHRNGVVHADLKLENIFCLTPNVKTIDALKESPLKLGDFGAAVELEPGVQTKGGVGTFNYMPPERLLQQSFTEKADVWGLGVLLYALIAGRLPFPGQDRMTVLQNVRMGPNMDLDEFRRVSPLAVDLIVAMLDPDPTKRPAVCTVLENPWMMGQVPQTARLGNTLANLRRNNMAKKFRAATRLLMAGGRVNRIARAMRAEELMMDLAGYDIQPEDIVSLSTAFFAASGGSLFVEKKIFEQVMSTVLQIHDYELVGAVYDAYWDCERHQAAISDVADTVHNKDMLFQRRGTLPNLATIGLESGVQSTSDGELGKTIAGEQKSTNVLKHAMGPIQDRNTGCNSNSGLEYAVLGGVSASASAGMDVGKTEKPMPFRAPPPPQVECDLIRVSERVSSCKDRNIFVNEGETNLRTSCSDSDSDSDSDGDSDSDSDSEGDSDSDSEGEGEDGGGEIESDSENHYCAGKHATEFPTSSLPFTSSCTSVSGLSGKIEFDIQRAAVSEGCRTSMSSGMIRWTRSSKERLFPFLAIFITPGLYVVNGLLVAVLFLVGWCAYIAIEYLELVGPVEGSRSKHRRKRKPEPKGNITGPEPGRKIVAPVKNSDARVSTSVGVRSSIDVGEGIRDSCVTTVPTCTQLILSETPSSIHFSPEHTQTPFTQIPGQPTGLLPLATEKYNHTLNQTNMKNMDCMTVQSIPPSSADHQNDFTAADVVKMLDAGESQEKTATVSRPLVLPMNENSKPGNMSAPQQKDFDGDAEVASGKFGYNMKSEIATIHGRRQTIMKSKVICINHLNFVLSIAGKLDLPITAMARLCFDLVDRDRTTFIDKREFRVFIESVLMIVVAGDVLDFDVVVDREFETCDKSGDGLISESEFVGASTRSNLLKRYQSALRKMWQTRNELFLSELVTLKETKKGWVSLNFCTQSGGGLMMTTGPWNKRFIAIHDRNVMSVWKKYEDYAAGEKGDRIYVLDQDFVAMTLFTPVKLPNHGDYRMNGRIKTRPRIKIAFADGECLILQAKSQRVMNMWELILIETGIQHWRKQTAI